jgi:hypothetical protein
LLAAVTETLWRALRGGLTDSGSTAPPRLPGSGSTSSPMKKPRAAGDRVKTDRKDAELLVRLLMSAR